MFVMFGQFVSAIHCDWIEHFIISRWRIPVWGCPRGVMVKTMDCGIVVREFVLQLGYYVHFRANTLGKRTNPPYPPSYGLNSTNTVLLWEWHWITCKGWYAIKQRNQTIRVTLRPIYFVYISFFFSFIYFSFFHSFIWWNMVLLMFR